MWLVIIADTFVTVSYDNRGFAKKNVALASPSPVSRPRWTARSSAAAARHRRTYARVGANVGDKCLKCICGMHAQARRSTSAYILMASIVMAYMVMAYIAMAYIVMACTVMAYVVLAIWLWPM